MTYSQVYRLPTTDAWLRQGEILSNLIHLPAEIDQEIVAPLTYDYAVVVTPDCDLEGHDRQVAAGKPGLLQILLMPLWPRTVVSNELWRQARANSKPEKQVLEACAADYDATHVGLPALYGEFRELFSIPLPSLERAVNSGKTVRRTALCSPYRDHLQHRLASHFGRVALERDHATS